MNLISRLFRKKPDVPLLPKRIPVVGERWTVKLDDAPIDPFPKKTKAAHATVLEVREGWVRYKIGDGFLFNDERMEIDRFTKCYLPIV